ncbi:MAG: B-box zinc finger protein [Anaerolineae bacterium]|nr:B-box zinc finger protein [Anaerolineae bacterium]
MRLQWDARLASGEALHCINHPQTETTLRCNSCGAPICVRCAVRTPVGFRCRACISAQQAHFYTSMWYDYPIAAFLSLVLSVPAAVIAGMAGWWFALIISPIAGGIIGTIVHWAIGRRRGRWIWLIVGFSMAVGTLATVVVMPRAFLSIVIYAVMAVGAAVGVLRLGRLR